jgi:hypothetical protein
MDQAMVFLNGWRLEFENTDHQVQGLGAWIFNVRREQTASGYELHSEQPAVPRGMEVNYQCALHACRTRVVYVGH